VAWFKKSKQPPGADSTRSPKTASNGTGASSPAVGSYLQRLKNRLGKTRKTLAGGLERILSGRGRVDDAMLEELEELLISADIGVDTTMQLVQQIADAGISEPARVREFLKEAVLEMLPTAAPGEDFGPGASPRVVMVVGVNGVGKTTTIGKLASRDRAAGRRVLIAASDTFRAAAVEQLAVWAQRAEADLVRHKENSDPAAVAFDAVTAALARGADVVYIDTAGRLHTNVNLMEELKKIKRSIAKKLPGAPHEVLLVLDATTGQNALSQARLFNAALGINALAVTKLDGTAKGGVVLAVCNELQIPLKYIGIGEKLEDLQPFQPDEFVQALFSPEP